MKIKYANWRRKEESLALGITEVHNHKLLYLKRNTWMRGYHFYLGSSWIVSHLNILFIFSRSLAILLPYDNWILLNPKTNVTVSCIGLFWIKTIFLHFYWDLLLGQCFIPFTGSISSSLGQMLFYECTYAVYQICFWSRARSGLSSSLGAPASGNSEAVLFKRGPRTSALEFDWFPTAPWAH